MSKGERMESEPDFIAVLVADIARKNFKIWWMCLYEKEIRFECSEEP